MRGGPRRRAPRARPRALRLLQVRAPFQLSHACVQNRVGDAQLPRQFISPAAPSPCTALVENACGTGVSAIILHTVRRGWVPNTPLHGGEPVALRALCEYAWRGVFLSRRIGLADAQEQGCWGRPGAGRYPAVKPPGWRGRRPPRRRGAQTRRWSASPMREAACGLRWNEGPVQSRSMATGDRQPEASRGRSPLARRPSRARAPPGGGCL